MRRNALPSFGRWPSEILLRMFVELTLPSFQHRMNIAMLVRNQTTFLNTEADFRLPGMVASSPLIRISAINHLDVTLLWRSREQRERE